MLKPKRVSITLLMIYLIALGCKQTEKENFASKTKESVSNGDSISKLLQQKVPQWQKELNIPNVGIGVIDNGKIEYLKVFGKDGTEAPDDMLFNIASITKVVFGTAVIKLTSKGKWDLEEPLANYFVDDDVKNDERHKKLNSIHVLSQQSGFVNWRHNHPTGKLTFDFEPGTTFNYSGEGMEYLRRSIEKKYNTSWSTIADTLLFKPLQMYNSTHSWDGITGIEKFSYFYDSEGKKHDLEDYSTIDNAADDVITTVEDLCKFGIDVMNGAGLKSSIYSQMVSPKEAITDNQNQALGWRLIEELPNGEYAIHHGGNDIGVATLLLLLPKSKRGIVVFTNADAGIVMCNNVVRAVFKEGKELIHRAYRSGSIDDIPKPIDIKDEILSNYLGKYEQPSGRQIEIQKSDNSLIMKMPGVPNFQLFPKSATSFFLLDFDPIIEFDKNSEGIEILKIIEGKNTIECKKIL